MTRPCTMTALSMALSLRLFKDGVGNVPARIVSAYGQTMESAACRHLRLAAGKAEPGNIDVFQRDQRVCAVTSRHDSLLSGHHSGNGHGKGISRGSIFLFNSGRNGAWLRRAGAKDQKYCTEQKSTHENLQQ